MRHFTPQRKSNENSGTIPRTLQMRTEPAAGYPSLLPHAGEGVRGASLGHSLSRIAIHSPISVPRGLGGPVLQRQPAPASGGGTPTVEENVGKAIKLLGSVQPAIIFEALSAVKVGGAGALVRAVPHEERGKAITSLFTLQLQVATLTGHEKALFQGAPPVQTDPATRTFAMTITISPAAATTAPEALARDLFHEGMHMQLFMDRALPAARQSAHLARISEYLTIARASSVHASLLRDLAQYIRANPEDKLKPVRSPASVAKEIVDQIIEEKFVIDETKRSSLSPKPSAPPTSTEVSKSYLSLTTRWLVTYLAQVSVSTADTSKVGSMAAALKSIWLEIDAKASAPPLYPVPIGMYLDTDIYEPEILPPPLPAGAE